MPAVPAGYHTITPQLHVSNGDKAIAHYKKALGAKELRRMVAPGSNKLMHAALEIGTSKVFVSEFAPPGQTPAGANASFYVYVANVDAAHKKAVAAGMTETMPPTDMFWGDRMSHLTDPFGHSWNMATHMREIGQAEMEKAMRQQFGGATAQKKAAKKVAAKK
jgi:PhnB protein